MSFKFSEIEGIDPELAAKLDGDKSIQDAITSHVTSSVENRLDVAKGEFKKKMDSLDAKRAAAEERAANAPDIDADELKALREARDKNPELQATLDAMKKKTEDAESALKAQSDKLLSMQRVHTVTQAINEYNTQFPTVAVKPDMHDVVSMLANDALKYDDESGQFRVYNRNGDIIATDKGAATAVDWLKMQRDERPSLFNVPAGSGAPGSKHNGSAEKIISRADFDKLPPDQRGKVAVSHQITD